MSLDHLFSSTILHVAVPDTSLEFPPPESVDSDDWLARLKSSELDRTHAFFDEQLCFLLTVRILHPTPESAADPHHPPSILLELLTHIQVSIEATYISCLPDESPSDSQITTRLSAPPRKSSLLTKPSSSRLKQAHPSIHPPTTPNPLPASGDQDKKYIVSEGALLLAGIWGTNTSDDSPEAFTLLWSKKEEAWVAVYRLGLTVSYLRVNYTDPLLCLTLSTTLREKPVITTSQPTNPLSKFITSFNDASKPLESSNAQAQGADGDSDEDFLEGFEEVNLLEGLSAGPTFGTQQSTPIIFPSTRIGNESRRKLFALGPIIPFTPVTPSPSPLSSARRAHPTIRKSYRKTLQTMSGFKVRMRTVFVPYVLLHHSFAGLLGTEEVEMEKERREAGNEERTVVLCVEIEDSGESEGNMGFEVEKVLVSIGGEGAKTTLIGWGDEYFSADAAKNTFPLRLGPMGQYNLLYAVTFLRSPEESDALSSGHTPKSGLSTDLQRAVTINVFGKPFALQSDVDSQNAQPSIYPTRTFSSRWNCVLDLAAHQGQPADVLDESDPGYGYPSVLPEPPSPFPNFAMHSSVSKGKSSGESGTVMYSRSPTPTNDRRSSLRGGKGGPVAARPPLKSALYNRSSLMSINLSNHPDSGSRQPSPLVSSRQSPHSPLPSPYLRAATTYSAPPPPANTLSAHHYGHIHEIHDRSSPHSFDTPVTPAYPAFPPKSALPTALPSLAPIASLIQPLGDHESSVEIRRGRGGVIPETPGPMVPGAFGEQLMLAQLQNIKESGQNVVLSIGLLPLSRDRKGMEGRLGMIYPFDTFTLDIFVLNQSAWPRRFEISCPRKRRRENAVVKEAPSVGGLGHAAVKMGYPGVLPLDNRVRIGMLRPMACQSVRMTFLAVSPGVHSIDNLTLTDIESGFAMNLRNVLDIVVDDPND